MIEGKLVNLRAPEVTDAERMWRWVNDREVTQHLQVRYPWSLRAEERFLRERTSTPASFGLAAFAIETKDGSHIGTVTLRRAQPEDRCADLGITLGAKEHWGKGYGSDAMYTVLRFGFEDMNLRRIELTVDDGHAHAIACYRRCGFTEEGRLRQHRFAEGRYRDQLQMGILREEFEAREREEAR
jgi:RimJ/RimL family protein N-acetyltransferase